MKYDKRGKKALISIIKNNNCIGISCEICPLFYDDYINCGVLTDRVYKVSTAKKLFIREYGKEALFEELL